MPVYVYKCNKCGKVVEGKYHMNEKKLERLDCCSIKCNGTMIRQYGNVAFKIPDDWTKNKIDFSKRPSRRKQFY